MDLRIAEPPIGGFPFLFGQLPPRGKSCRYLLGLAQFRDRSPAKGDQESLALADSA